MDKLSESPKMAPCIGKTCLTPRCIYTIQLSARVHQWICKIRQSANLSIWEYSAQDIDKDYHRSWEVQIESWMDANMFAAILMATFEPNGPSEALHANHARWNLSSALEVAIVGPAQFRRTEICVPAAVNWLLAAGKYLLSYCRREEDVEEQYLAHWIGGDNGGDSLWTGTDGLDMGRWRFWKTRFGEISRLRAAENVIRISQQAVDRWIDLSEKSERDLDAGTVDKHSAECTPGCHNSS